MRAARWNFAILPLIGIVLIGSVLVGCSDTSGTVNERVAAKQAAPTGQSTTPRIANVGGAADAEIRQVTEWFMRAIVRGDAVAAREWITPIAARRVEAGRTVLSPLGIAVQELKVGEVRLISADEAAAQCLVTEAGTNEPQEIGCLLKRGPAGWRVCGLASDGGAEQGPVMISFEHDPPAATPSANEYVAQPSVQGSPDPLGPSTAQGSSPVEETASAAGSSYLR